MRMQRVLQHILWPGHFKVSNTQCVLVCVCVWIRVRVTGCECMRYRVVFALCVHFWLLAFKVVGQQMQFY